MRAWPRSADGSTLPAASHQRERAPQSARGRPGAAHCSRRRRLLPTPVAHAPLVALGGILYLVGGAAPGGAPVARIVRIDPGSGGTTVAGRLPHPLADSAAVRVGSRTIVLGGTSPIPSSAVLAFS